MWQGLVGPCHFCLWDFLMWVLDGVPDWSGVKKYESWLLGPGLDLILFIVQLGLLEEFLFADCGYEFLEVEWFEVGDVFKAVLAVGAEGRLEHC